MRLRVFADSIARGARDPLSCGRATPPMRVSLPGVSGDVSCGLLARFRNEARARKSGAIAVGADDLRHATQSRGQPPVASSDAFTKDVRELPLRAIRIARPEKKFFGGISNVAESAGEAGEEERRRPRLRRHPPLCCGEARPPRGEELLASGDFVGELHPMTRRREKVFRFLAEVLPAPGAVFP